MAASGSVRVASQQKSLLLAIHTGTNCNFQTVFKGSPHTVVYYSLILTLPWLDHHGSSCEGSRYGYSWFTTHLDSCGFFCVFFFQIAYISITSNHSITCLELHPNPKFKDLPFVERGDVIFNYPRLPASATSASYHLDSEDYSGFR